ncbi:hypothetical protein TSTA_085520 [Talaromyces stipitatus ATCC 10500]|uniref:Uncharacterized protein n=1 Tax=Talaromyces stipitatus (strain ATCC 10500 / CBS 375.48 / QM 6759 / NRRL 1006) TaxID=441959 RepID=B8M1U3_TALSN|nr:uncharacterized protein TSTA_085520 [Talaromyces stipitatus ATCC 10500]EED21321.1 hypothetical protein TSTA_085520 [Talaromyces stipitatus ATCC 10500]
MLITTALKRLALNAGINTSPVMRAAPTGVAILIVERFILYLDCLLLMILEEDLVAEDYEQ